MNGFWAFLLGKNLRVELGLSRWCSGKESICQSRRHIRDVNLIPGLGQSLEEGIATYSSILAWKIPWREEPIRLLSMGSQSQTCLLQLSMRGRVGEFLVVHICHEFSKVFVPICTTTSSNFLCSSIVTTSLFHLSHSSGAGALFLSSFDFSINCWHLFFFFFNCGVNYFISFNMVPEMLSFQFLCFPWNCSSYRRLLSSSLSLQFFHFLSLIVAFCHCYTYFTGTLQGKASCNIHQSSQPRGFSESLNSNSFPSLVSFTLVPVHPPTPHTPVSKSSPKNS